MDTLAVESLKWTWFILYKWENWNVKIEILGSLTFRIFRTFIELLGERERNWCDNRRFRLQCVGYLAWGRGNCLPSLKPERGNLDLSVLVYACWHRTDQQTLIRFHSFTVWGRGIDRFGLCFLENNKHFVSGERAKREELLKSGIWTKGQPLSPLLLLDTGKKELITFRMITGIYLEYSLYFL